MHENKKVKVLVQISVTELVLQFSALDEMQKEIIQI